MRAHSSCTPEKPFRGKRMGFYLTLRRLKEEKFSVRPTPFPETMDVLPPILQGFGESSEGRVILLCAPLPITKEFQECLEQTCMVTGI